MNEFLLIILIAIAGGLGAITRYLVDTSFSARAREAFPVGILVVNITGSFALGLATGATASLGVWSTVIGVGFLGGYTTFSTASLDSVMLLLERRITAGLFNSVGMAVLCVAAAVLGIAITS